MKNIGFFILLSLFLLACSKKEEEHSGDTTKPITLAKTYVCDCKDTFYTNSSGLISSGASHYSQFLFVKLSNPTDSLFEISTKQNLDDSAYTNKLVFQLRMDPYQHELWGGFGMDDKRTGYRGQYVYITDNAFDYYLKDSLYTFSLGYRYIDNHWHCIKYN